MWFVYGLIIFVIIVSYPLHDVILYILWRRRRHATGAAALLQDWPDLTVIIPAANEQSTIRARIENILDAYPPDRTRILVVLNNSSDSTRSICQALNVPVIESSPGKLNALEAGRLSAETDYILVTDCDVIHGHDMIKRLVSELARSPDNVCAVSAFCRYTFSSCSRIGRTMNAHERKHAKQCHRQGEVASSAMVQGPCYVYRKHAFPPYPVHATEDELSVAIKIVQSGYRAKTDAGAVCEQRGSASFWPVLTMLTRHAARQILSCIQNVGIIFAPRSRMYGLFLFPFYIVLPRCLPLVTAMLLLVPFFIGVNIVLYYMAGVLVFAVLAILNPFAALQLAALHGAWFYALLCARQGSSWNHKRGP